MMHTLLNCLFFKCCYLKTNRRESSFENNTVNYSNSNAVACVWTHFLRAFLGLIDLLIFDAAHTKDIFFLFQTSTYGDVVRQRLRKSSKPIVMTPFCSVSRARNASVKRWICTQVTMNWSTEISFRWTGSFFAIKNWINCGEKRNPIWVRAETRGNVLTHVYVQSLIYLPWESSASSMWPDASRS